MKKPRLLNSRRDFIKKTGTVSSAMAFGGVLPIFNAKSYSRIKGANDRINISVMGVNSRGNALAQNFAIQNNCDVIHVCDVDTRAITKCLISLKDKQSFTAESFIDFRKSLENKDLDIMVIAAPDHWHAPAS